MLAEFAELSGSTHIAIAFLFSLLVGSFLNVVVLRYPKMVFHSWTQQSREWLELESLDQDTVPTLSEPASHCPNCKSPLKAWHNIPIVSFVLLGGKCARCKYPISWRYPLIELLTASSSAVVMAVFGWSLAALFGIALTWVLIVLSFIDIDHQILPDDIVMPTLWLGLGISYFGVYTDSSTALVGAIAGYMSFWIVAQTFKLITGKVGMGNGDFKLMALFGAWFGWQLLPLVVIISSLLGSVFGLAMIMIAKSGRETKIPFGPYIALAGWIAMLWGQRINQSYLNYAGL